MPQSTHVFVNAGHTTWDGKPICMSCGSVRSHKIHEMPDVPEEARLVDARKLGETP